MTLILVTGSRTWDDRDILVESLLHVRDTVEDKPGKRMAVMHGACPIGADMLADFEAARMGWIVLPRPADWEHQGKRAGFARNDVMVAECVDYQRRGTQVRCLAFVRPCERPECDGKDAHWTHGAGHCGAAAEDSGLPTAWVRG